jgi:hypothetical protein
MTTPESVFCAVQKTIGSERQSSDKLMPEVATVCVVYRLLSFNLILMLHPFLFTRNTFEGKVH